MTASTIVLVTDLFMLLFAIFFVGLSLYLGLRLYKDLVFWRKIKLVSSLLGIVGLFLLLMNFEITIKSLTLGQSREALFLEYIDAKTFIATSMATTCSKSSGDAVLKQTCWDMLRIHNQIGIVNFHNDSPFERIVNWQKNPELDGFVEVVNSKIDYMNSLMPSDRKQYLLLSDDNKIFILFSSLLLLVLAISGSVGEAAFQLRTAQQTTNNKPEENKSEK